MQISKQLFYYPTMRGAEVEIRTVFDAKVYYIHLDPIELGLALLQPKGTDTAVPSIDNDENFLLIRNKSISTFVEYYYQPNYPGYGEILAPEEVVELLREIDHRK